MAIRQYVGARYVPRFTGLYDATQIYDALDVVDNGAGTAYIAKKTVPAGTALTDTNYWFVYGASSGAILDLQTRMQTAENDIDNAEGDITALQGRMTAAEGKILTNYNTRRKRNFILIGDSFAAGVVSTTDPRATGWNLAFKNMWEGNGHGNVYYSLSPLPGVSGFASSLQFLTMLQDCESQFTDKNSITDIVVLGGTNDMAETSGDVRANVAAFCAYVQANYPYARLAIGVYGSNKNRLLQHVYDDYKTCINYGAEFIADLFNLICDTNYISDGTHLTAAGYDFYNPYVCQAVITGHSHYMFYLTIDAMTATDPQLRVIVSENDVRMSFTKPNTNDAFTKVFTMAADIELAKYSENNFPRIAAPEDINFGSLPIFTKNSANEYYVGAYGILRWKFGMTSWDLHAKITNWTTGIQESGVYLPSEWYPVFNMKYA